ncbi:MAG: SGNH/GDSL hydrolase family protein [Labilithrix sp.]|nr:SGNH/GDSL hydrolase family protein [Labilithrix sp.]MCW5834257.1 SGNH/GDSL hydrolase family protein [Labilithrix sp.]
MLGESTAVGVGAATQDEALAFSLARALARTRDLSVDVQAVGRSGANVATVRRELALGVEPPVDAALVVLGVNDTLELTRGARWTSALGALVRDLRSRGARHVLFTGVPPLGELASLPQPTRSALGARAAYLDRLLASVCASERAHHLAFRSPLHPELVARDGFHPSARGYAAWAAALAAAWPV